MARQVRLPGRPFSRRGFLFRIGLSAAAVPWLPSRGAAQGTGDDDVLLRAMRDELERSRQLRVVGGGGDEIPYLISYLVSDQNDFSASASLGSITNSNRNRFRVPLIEVRVGSYDFDNTGHVYSGYYSGSRFDSEPWPIDDDYQALREALWLATDHAYKAAVESIARKRAALNSVAESADKLPDYSKADPVTSIGKVGSEKMDDAQWRERIAKLSGIFKAYPEILASGVEFNANLGPTYFTTSEGTSLRYQDDIVWLIARAEVQAAEGTLMREGVAIQSLELRTFPGESELTAQINGLAERMRARVKAPIAESYAGPVLFEPPAAAQLFAQLIGDNLRAGKKPISEGNRPVNYIPSEFEGRTGARVLPEWFDVTDDPTQSMWQGKPLAGHYLFDAEGVRPQTVSVIEKGVFKSFLTTRQPVKGFPQSNGHARLGGNYGVKAASISNLFVKVSQSQPLTDLKQRMLQMLKDRDKPFGMLVRRLDYPYSSSGADLQQLMASSAQSGSARPTSPPTLLFRVYPDGREELVRGLRFRGLSARSLRDVMAASAETAMFDFVNNGAPLAFMGAGGMLAPSAVIAPGLLFEELELERPQEQLQKPPIVPPPNA
jgi:TldD protein